MFILRTTTPPSIAKLLELERIVIVDNAGVNIPAGTGEGQACLVGEFPQGPFTRRSCNLRATCRTCSWEPTQTSSP